MSSLFLSSCIAWNKLPLTGLDHPSRFANEIRETGQQSYEYAQMAYNSYDVSDGFKLGPSLTAIEQQDVSDNNFQYKIFHRKNKGQLTEVIIAFRGTDAILGDVSGNVFLKQQKAGLELFDELRGKYKKVKITVAGHSLGGAIASHVTLNRKSVDGFFFNTSPRFLKGKRKYTNDRYSIVEYGEILKLLRLFGKEPTQIYTSINCTSGGLGDQHSSRNLAECLTWMAGWDDSKARASVIRNNIGKPDTRKNGPNIPRLENFSS